MADTQPALLARIHAMTAEPFFRNVVLRHAAGLDRGQAATRFNMSIHPRDQMLTHSLREHRDAGAAFSQYFAIALQQYASARQIMQASFGDDRDLDVLDFACGYGRLLRFLGLIVAPGRIWASDLQTDAVDFVRDTFGVQALASHADPARFAPERRFDFIWVASLFSHLPEPLFHAWLARLLALLTPKGVLCFSVRDASLLPPSSLMPASGIVYAPHSENDELAGEIYGTTYADEAFVRDALQRAGGDDRPYLRLRKALANEQDLYIVAADPDRDLAALRTFRRGPWGWVDVRRVANGSLDLQGWAASPDDGVVERVDIELDGVTHSCRTGISRPDVAAAFGDRRLADAGWDFRRDLGSGVGRVRVTVSAVTARGERALLYTGDVAQS